MAKHEIQQLDRSSEGVPGSLTFAMHLCFHTLFHLRFCTHTVAHVATVTLKDQRKPFKPVYLSHHTCNHLGKRKKKKKPCSGTVFVFPSDMESLCTEQWKHKVSKIAERLWRLRGERATVFLRRRQNISSREAMATQNEHTFRSSRGCNDVL